MADLLDNIPELALEWHQQGKGAALATVVETWGSAPRPAGSQLAVSGAGEIMGSVSGGCVEGAVVSAAQEAITDGKCQLLTFGVADDDAFAVGLACGGTIRILVEPVAGAQGIPPALLADLVAARTARQPVAMTVDLTDWSRQLYPRADAPAAIRTRFRTDRSGLEGESLFVTIHNTPLRLIVVGAVHIAQALMPMARLLGYDATLIDPRDAFGSAARFPGERIITDYPDAAMAAAPPDLRTAVVTLAHDPKIDDPAIMAALASDCFYLGCLGSTRTHAKRLERLRQAGIDAAGIARIRGPVGLDIGAKSPAEIAIAILAEITGTLRRG